MSSDVTMLELNNLRNTRGLSLAVSYLVLNLMAVEALLFGSLRRKPARGNI